MSKQIDLLDRTKNVVGVTIIDEKYYEQLLSTGSVCRGGNGYANFTTRGPSRKVYGLHRFIFYNLQNKHEKKGYVIDHINRDRLDNRLENLRL